MMNDIQKQKPFTVSQIKTEKPNAPRTKSILSGYIAGSMNGGHNKVIAWKKVMAGEKHYEYRLRMNLQMLTPLTPSYQKLNCTIRTYFVPNSRIWENAEKYTAQKGGSAEIKISEIPNLGGKTIPSIYNNNTSRYYNRTSTDVWRNAFISSYIPRVGENFEDGEYTKEDATVTLPKMSILPLRGRRAIFNDYERHKEYEAEQKEYNSDTVSQEEWESYLPLYAEDNEHLNMRAKRENNYYTNYRTEIQGFEASYPPSNMSADESLLRWASWESKIAEARAEANNAQKNDWDIIAEIRGSQLLSEGKVQLLGKKTFPLNYSAITQNTYNNNESVRAEFRVMGKQGAYSYTDIEIPLYAAMEFKEEGYIHVIATVSADTVFETAIDRNLLNVTPLDEYRPDMEGDKFDVLYYLENGTRKGNDLLNLSTEVLGFKRKYSELFKLPNVVQADMTSADILETKNSDLELNGTRIITNNTYQFFEEDRYMLPGETIILEQKKIWKDYTDLMINKNQAIKNEVETYEDLISAEPNIKGQNQIFFVGVCNLIADLPVNEEVKNDFQKWAEH